MSGCQARYTRDDTRLLFGDGSHWFYVEERCSLSCSGSTCQWCSLKTDTNVQSSRRFKHGLVGQAYPEKSHLFGSPWYLAKIRTYGEPSQESIEKAMMGQKKAQGTVQGTVQGTTQGTVQGTVQGTTQTTVTKTKTFIKKSEEKVIPKISESSEDPLPVRVVSQRNFQPLRIQETRYWKDSDNKVYECLDKKLGKFIGIWNDERQEIQDDDEYDT